MRPAATSRSPICAADFDAVLIAVGAHRSRDLTIPGVNLDGVYKGIDFLLNVNLGYRFTIGKKVLVIGGGNVAMDVARSAAREVLRQHAGGVENFEPSQGSMDAVAAREMMDVSFSALRLGAQEVHLVCLENRAEMPAALEEIEEAEEEGIIIHPGFGPKQIIGENGRAVALEVLKTKTVFDANHRFSPTFFENSETRLDCDTIIMAIGQAPNLQFLGPDDGVDVSPRGLIAVNPKTLMTSASAVFAGGDCVFGPRLIIDSVADGKRAAVGIDEFLRGTKHPAPIVEVEVLERHRMPLQLLDLVRPPIPMLPLNRRTGVTEVEIGFDEEAAMIEAQRCLHCWVNTVFEGNEADATSCILCGGCVDVCPENCLELVSLDRIAFDDATTRELTEMRGLLGVELDDIQAEELGVITGSVMLKDESRCIRCGLCAARCPAGTITMESYNLVSADPTGLISVESIDSPLRANQSLRGRTEGITECPTMYSNLLRDLLQDSIVELSSPRSVLAHWASPPRERSVFSYEYLSPNVLYEPSAIVNAGKPESFALNSVTMDVHAGIYLVRAEEGYFALNAICTHLGCLTVVEPGPWDHRVPVPRKQVQTHRRED